MLKMIGDCIALKRTKPASTIEIVGHKEHCGEVIAVGPGKLHKQKNGKTILIPMTVKPGDVVHFSHRAGMERRVNGEDILFIHEADVLCIIDASAAVMTDNAADETRDVVGVFDMAGGA